MNLVKFINLILSLQKSETWSTKDVYNFIKKYAIYCHIKEWDVVDENVKHVLSFLTHLFYKEKLAFNSINVARTAISSFLWSDNKVGEHPLISKFMKGVYNKRPFIPKNTIVWDTRVVLDFL